MARIVKASADYTLNRPSVFLAGTIDNGKGVDWQTEVENELDDLDIIILNPRRNDWNPDWEQTRENDEFSQQVSWELTGLDMVDEVFFFFAPHSYSPVTMLELGLCLPDKNVTLVCAKNFWRCGNIEITADACGVEVYHDLATGVEVLRRKLS